jgi:hypothetical protein
MAMSDGPDPRQSDRMIRVANQRSRVCGAAGRDRFWLAMLAICFLVSLAASWQRWSDPVVDVGREMNQPLRLAGGEMLYSDVRHIYGPLSPWLHAVLFHIFTPSLTVLYLDGIITATIALALVYWLGRQIMSPAAAGAATLNVMSFCVFKPAGNYILPYSYNSLHGAVLGLITLAILVTALRPEAPRSGSLTTSGALIGQRPLMFLLAGLVAGLATLAKTEMGAAAVAAGVTAAILVSYPDLRRAARFGLIFILPAAALTTAVYALIAARVGWSTLAFDSWLLVYTMPPEIAHFNAEISGLAHPLRSLGRMLIALAKLGMLAAGVAATSSIIATSTSGRRERRAFDAASRETAVVSHPWRVLGAVVALLILMWVTTGLDRDKGPYLAIPFVLAGTLVMLLWSLRTATNPHTATLVVLTIYALASLARVILHVRSGGAYASYLLPVAVVIFTYLWVGPFADSLRDAHVSRMARTTCLTLLVLAALLNMAGLAHRYRTRNSAPIETARGTMIAGPDIALAFNEALAYIDRHTEAGDAVAVMPEGTSINFLSGRRNPLREEIVTPGYLDTDGEVRAIGQLRDAHTALILIPNRPTREFGPAAFGRDYCQRLMRWIEEDYRICAIFGPVKDASLEIGDKPYFIRAYCPR